MRTFKVEWRVRSLVERVPVMITPRWVRVKARPIAIDDVLRYLVASLDLPDNQVTTYEIGGSEQVSYSDLVREYARQHGLRRLIARTGWYAWNWLWRCRGFLDRMAGGA